MRCKFASHYCLTPFQSRRREQAFPIYKVITVISIVLGVYSHGICLLGLFLIYNTLFIVKEKNPYIYIYISC